MIRIGIIGLGDIAEKAYLPVLSRKAGLEIHLCSRSETRLKALGDQYRIVHLHTNTESLIASHVQGAFVHTATDSHFDIVQKLLLANIPVFVDKPITMDYHLSKQLVELAEERNVLFMVGFNRRYAPVYQNLKEIKNPTLIIMQKNRKSLPDPVRRFIIDDFIHVVDTLRLLFPYPIDNLLVHGMKNGGILHQVVIQLVSKTGAVAIGIMNRDTATTEEKVEVMSAAEKRIAYNVADLIIEEGSQTGRLRQNDWEPTLYKRGFEQMADDFLQAVAGKGTIRFTARDSLITHEICEQIVEKLERAS